MDLQSMLHENKNIGVMLDLSGNQPLEHLDIKGVLTEEDDAEEA
jgi:hypothetical protein